MDAVRIADCGIVILAAGQSERFGSPDKLLAEFRGRPMASHTARTAAAMEAKVCCAIVRPNQPDLMRCFADHGVECLVNTDPVTGQGRSLAIGIEAMDRAGCLAAIVLLADMPLIRPHHLGALMGDSDNRDAVLAHDGVRTLPPAIIRKSLFPDLIRLTSDQGGKAVLNGSGAFASAAIPRDALVDIDTPDDLRQ